MKLIFFSGFDGTMRLWNNELSLETTLLFFKSTQLYGNDRSLCRPRGHSSARRRRCGNNRRAVILQCRGIIITFT